MKMRKIIRLEILLKHDSITKEFHCNLAETVILVHMGISFHWTKLKENIFLLDWRSSDYHLY